MPPLPQDPGALERRQAFYRRIGQDSLAPLWEVMGALVPREPASA